MFVNETDRHEPSKVIDLVMGNSDAYIYAPIVSDCRSMLTLTRMRTIDFCSRNANKAADAIANHAISFCSSLNQLCFTCFCTPPPEVDVIIRHETRDVILNV